MNRVTFVVGLFVFGSGCGHALMRGTMVTTTSPSEGQICMHDGAVAVGDTVRIVHHTCSSPEASNAAQRHCVASQGGKATVTELLNEHYAIVRAEDGTTLHEGDTVEPE